jgi:anaerobic dimethyl sulfoxide reductase subunit A
MVTPAGGNYLLYSGRAVPPRGGLPTDYDILCGLADTLGFGAAFSENRDPEEWLGHLIDRSEIENPAEFRRTGIYFRPGRPRIGLSEFVKDPRAHPLSTPSGLIELTSPAQEAAGLSAAPDHFKREEPEAYPFQLVTPKVLDRIHSQGFNLDWTRASDAQRLWLHPADADGLGLSRDSLALVENRIGRVRVPVRLTEDIRPGAACLAEGAWPRFDDEGIETVGSANALTSTEPTLPSQGSRTHSVNVRIVPA